MRISDWSSDVCSSDLPIFRQIRLNRSAGPAASSSASSSPSNLLSVTPSRRMPCSVGSRGPRIASPAARSELPSRMGRGTDFDGNSLLAAGSEEHPSELQSLMRSSSAVFCLKKKKHHKGHHQTQKTIY